MARRHHHETHYVTRIGWMRAAVLGANDGIVSVASLIVGVGAAGGDKRSLLLAGVAGWVAGAMSMAAGEYVSVSSQADTEKADLERERQELAANPHAELKELAGIYVRRGLDPALALQVAEQLSARDALESHARDELGITEITSARPVQAAFASAGSFSIGAALPLAAALTAPRDQLIPTVTIAALVFLAALGALGAQGGGASKAKGVARVVFWGAAAMAVTAGVGRLFGVTAG